MGSNWLWNLRTFFLYQFTPSRAWNEKQLRSLLKAVPGTLNSGQVSKPQRRPKPKWRMRRLLWCDREGGGHRAGCRVEQGRAVCEPAETRPEVAWMNNQQCGETLVGYLVLFIDDVISFVLEHHECQWNALRFTFKLQNVTTVSSLLDDVFL